jgi:hypothetical protein
MTKKRTPAKKVEKPVPEETLEEPVVGPDEKVEEPVEEQDPDEIEVSVKTDPNAMPLVDCEKHVFTFLRTAKIKGKMQPEGVRYRRVDTFFCHFCLRYTTVAREEVGKVTPDWWMGP